MAYILVVDDDPALQTLFKQFLKKAGFGRIVVGTGAEALTYAEKQKFDLVFLDLPAVGSSVTIGESFGEIESVKAVSSLYAPVTGEVIESNAELGDNLEWLSEEPFGKAWMIKVKLSAQGSELMDGAAYVAHCKAEG